MLNLPRIGDIIELQKHNANAPRPTIELTNYMSPIQEATPAAPGLEQSELEQVEA